MADPTKPRVGSFTRLFILGFALGLLVGGVGGAYLSGRMETSDRTLIAPKSARPAPTPAAAPPAGETGASGQTGATTPPPEERPE